jgi:capsule polysaccharide export protein KpsC/LpsZ
VLFTPFFTLLNQCLLSGLTGALLLSGRTEPEIRMSFRHGWETSKDFEILTQKNRKVKRKLQTLFTYFTHHERQKVDAK